MRRPVLYSLAIAVLLLSGAVSGSAVGTSQSLTKQQIAQRIIASGASRYMTSPARSWIESLARGDHRFVPDSIGTTGASYTGPASTAKPAVLGAPLANVRVNKPAEDSHQTDQTTQSETTVAVSGANVAVGFNDSQNVLQPFLTAGADLTGYAYSTNGGASFTDGGVLPNAPGSVNLGDPWMATDSGGTMYYSNLAASLATGSLLVGVASSANGGKTWSQATPIPPPLSAGPFYSADKDALITAGRGNLYDVWDDQTFNPATNSLLSGLPVAHSTDGGMTWNVTYASQVVLGSPTSGCSFSQYIGAQPLVAKGIVYDAAELISVNDPNCIGAPVTFSEVVFYSNDGGTTWHAGANQLITSSTQGFGAFQLGTGQLMRNLEFPTLALFKGNVWMAWNDGGDGSGHSHIRLAKLNSFGQFSSIAFITSGFNDEIQPALSADTGLHVAYYRIMTDLSGNGHLDVLMSNSTGGTVFSIRRVTSQAFPGVFTLPQFDPVIAATYMGDYIANVSDGVHQYVSWGDNRDMVFNFLWPSGRHDPDVFFARQ